MISSYRVLLIGIIPRFDSTSAIISAMIAPEILEAQAYFCSKKIAVATDATRMNNSVHVSSAATRVSLPRALLKNELNIIGLLSDARMNS